METKRYAGLTKLVLSLIICQAAGIIGQVFTSKSLSDWYPSLAKPSFTPPGSVIGLIWIIIFTLMGIALFLVWREDLEKPGVKIALSIFAAQLVVNVLWNAAFFGLRSPCSD